MEKTNPLAGDYPPAHVARSTTDQSTGLRLAAPPAGDSAVTTSITVEGEPDEVWELLTDDDELSTWLGDQVTLDPVPDGAGHLVDDDGVGREIRVDEVEPGRSISWRWWPDGDDDQTTRVAIELVPADGGTEIRVTEWVA